MKKNITDLITDFKALQNLEILAEYQQLIKLCDTLLADFPNQSRTEPFYSFTLEVIDQVKNLEIGFGSDKAYLIPILTMSC